VATIGTEEPLAVAVAEAIRTGDLPVLRRLLAEHPGLATARLGEAYFAADLTPPAPEEINRAFWGVYRPDNPERTKRYFREPPGRRRTHLHVRRAGSFSEQWALLFRDYLRAHRAVADDYAAVKRRLAIRFRDDRAAYTNAKAPFMWEVIRRADEWAQAQGWLPGPSDA
jgi:GrpB protein